MAFALACYGELLEALSRSGYRLSPVRHYFEGAEAPRVYLRHDVDRLPGRALAMAQTERALGVASTYYFRCTRDGAFPARAVQRTAALGHEIGFHYECVSRHRGQRERAAAAFRAELGALRSLGVEVVTVAAHGSPLSSHSNMGFSRELDRRDLGLLGEPSLDVDFARVLYVTDSGGVFGSPANLRDRVEGRNLEAPTPPRELARRLRPQAEPLVLLNAHPERWPAGRAAVAFQTALDGLANNAKRLRRAGR